MTLYIERDVNPIHVNGTTSAEVSVTLTPSFVKFVRWYDAISSGDLCHLVDSSSNTIMKMRAEIDHDTQMWPVYTRYNDIYCRDLDSGELFIYIR